MEQLESLSMQFAVISAVSSSLLLGLVPLPPLTSSHQCRLSVCLSVCMLLLSLASLPACPDASNINNNIEQLPQQLGISLGSQHHRYQSQSPSFTSSSLHHHHHYPASTHIATLLLFPLPLFPTNPRHQMISRSHPIPSHPPSKHKTAVPPNHQHYHTPLYTTLHHHPRHRLIPPTHHTCTTPHSNTVF
jgi:hypothetical protein